jgi:hypothetical protein
MADRAFDAAIGLHATKATPTLRLLPRQALHTRQRIRHAVARRLLAKGHEARLFVVNKPNRCDRVVEAAVHHRIEPEEPPDGGVQPVDVGTR